jgi:hypothetical protein
MRRCFLVRDENQRGKQCRADALPLSDELADGEAAVAQGCERRDAASRRS